MRGHLDPTPQNCYLLQAVSVAAAASEQAAAASEHAAAASDQAATADTRARAALTQTAEQGIATQQVCAVGTVGGQLGDS